MLCITMQKSNQGHTSNWYHFKVVDTVNDISHLFKELTDITAKFGIKKSTVYNMIKNANNSCPKYSNLQIYRTRSPVYKLVHIKY